MEFYFYADKGIMSLNEKSLQNQMKIFVLQGTLLIT